MADMINLVVSGGGLLVLLGLAFLVGRVAGGAQDAAWRRIAEARRLQNERERAFLDCWDSSTCRDCPSWQYLRDLHGR